MSVSNTFVKESDTIPSSSSFTSAVFDASAYTKARFDCHVTARTSGGVKFKLQAAAKADGPFFDVKATGSISAVGHTELLVNGEVTAGEVLGFVRVIADTATDSGVGISATVTGLFM